MPYQTLNEKGFAPYPANIISWPDGYQIIDDVITETQIIALQNAIERVPLPKTKGGIRNAEKKFGEISKLTSSSVIKLIAQTYLAESPKLVRALLFHKSAVNNWLVSWHQDKTVCVTETFECKGWGPWTVKDNVVHVQPPEEVLNRMVTIRIHLDSVNADNGGLKVIPGSHQKGILKLLQITEWVDKNNAICCDAKPGSALVMSPLLLHASGKASRPKAFRRVLHLEYCDYPLPEGVSWA